MLNNRLITVGLEVDGKIKEYQSATVSGIKTASKTKDKCTITLENVMSDTSNYVISQTSPQNNDPKQCGVYVNVGRVQWGTSLFYTGDVIKAKTTGITDTDLIVECAVGGFLRTQHIDRYLKGLQDLSVIAQTVANDNNLKLNMLIPDKKIKSWSYNGSIAGQINALADLAECQCFADKGELILKAIDQGRSERVRVLNSNDIIGQIETNEWGIVVNCLYDQVTDIGSRVLLKSARKPFLNGEWLVYKMEFNLQTRGDNFHFKLHMNKSGRDESTTKKDEQG